MICNNCGKEIDNDSKFCEFCGINIIETEHSSSVKVANKSNIIIIVCVIICIAVFCIWYSIQNNNNSSNLQNEALYNNNSFSDNKIISQKETKPKRINLFDLQTITYISYSSDYIGYDMNSPDFRILEVYQIKSEFYEDLLYTYKILTNKKRRYNI